jgi:hypothetical protein
VPSNSEQQVTAALEVRLIDAPPHACGLLRCLVQGYSMLHAAAYCGDVQFARGLLAAGCTGHVNIAGSVGAAVWIVLMLHVVVGIPWVSPA